jgi:hypothetical protein
VSNATAVVTLLFPHPPSCAVQALGADMVPRFGMASTMDLRESLATLHATDGLLDEIDQRQAQQQGEAAGDGELGAVLFRHSSFTAWLLMG